MWFEWLGMPRNRCWKTTNTTKRHVHSQVSLSHTLHRPHSKPQLHVNGFSRAFLFHRSFSVWSFCISYFLGLLNVSPSSFVHQRRFLVCLAVHTLWHTNLLLHLYELQTSTYVSSPNILTALRSHTLHMLTRPTFTGISSDFHITLFSLIFHKGTQSQCPFTPTRPEKATWNEAALALCPLACCVHYAMSNFRWIFPVSWPCKQHSELK